MVHAVIHNGQIEPQGPIPESWEGQTVRLVPLTPDDVLADLESRLAALHAMGPVELDADERANIRRELEVLNELSKQVMKS